MRVYRPIPVAATLMLLAITAVGTVPATASFFDIPDDCTILGTEGDDVLVGTSGPDIICGLGGNDTLIGNGNDDLDTDPYSWDVLFGGPGNDILRGSGIDSEVQEAIFEPFHTTKPSGLGMGLAICRRLVSAHGGRLWLSDTSDSGATFCFSIPVSEDASE